MQKELNKLKKLGMTPKAAMLFIRSIAEPWYNIGTWNMGESFDTKFSRELSEPKLKTSK